MMTGLLPVEEWVRVSAGLGLFVVVVTIALMQAVKPYLRSFVQAASLSGLRSRADPERLSKVKAKAWVAERYPQLAELIPQDLAWHLPEKRSKVQWEEALLDEQTKGTGVPNDLYMRMVQNAAQAILDQPNRDIHAYVALTRGAALPDRLAGLFLGDLSPAELEHLGRAPRGKDPEQISPAALAAAAVRANLAAAAERELDALQVGMAARWRIAGRLVAVALGVLVAVLAGIASGVVSGGGLVRGAIGLVALVVVGAILPLWVESWIVRHRTLVGPPKGAWARLNERTTRISLLLLPPVALVGGIGLLAQQAGEAVYSLIGVGAVAALVAATAYDAAKAVGRRR